MRTSAGLKLLLAAVIGASAFACSSNTGQEDEEVSADNLTQSELAREALKIMGASQVPLAAGEQASCSYTGCHSINPVTLRQWNDQFMEAKAFLEGDHTQEEKINFFRQNPRDDRTGFTPERIGIMTAGAHLALGANVNRARYPEVYKQGQLLAEVFRGKEDLYREFRKEMLMPVLTDYPRLTPRQYEVILTWFKNGMPKLDEIIPENDRPATCVDNFGPLRERTSRVKGTNWSAHNRSQRLPMFACSGEGSATECFKQQRDGKDIFASAATTEFARTWPLEGSTVRILRELSAPNSFWLRSSADGRFAATGGGRNGGAQAIDLKSTLETGEPRDIGLDASYDPDFWPDNKAFMFQGGTKFCAQSILEKPSTTKVTFGEAECSNLGSASGLYQTVGQQIGDNSISDRFILYSVWAGDSGQYSASARDTTARAGADSGINIYTAVARGNDVEEGYQIRGDAFKITTPYRGDTMMARSGKMLGSRIAFETPADGSTAVSGYSIDELGNQLIDSNYRFTLSSLGTVCMKGNKANFSYDERFLATHHYNEPSDFTADDDPEYLAKGSADIYMADFVTGKKARVTKMGPGQFALYAHFRSDGWLYFLVVDHNTGKYYVVASDWAVRQAELAPTP